MKRAARVTGIVLCGGSGRRLQGADKPLLHLQARPMLAHVLERLEPQVSSILISANRHLDEYARYGHLVIPDLVPDQGPLAGVVSALAHTDDELLFLCPGDAPMLGPDLVERLLDRLTEELDAVVPHDGERAQHLFLLLRRQAAENVAPYLEAGGRSVAGFLETLKLAVLAVEEASAFTNVNTAADLMAVAQKLDDDWCSDPE